MTQCGHTVNSPNKQKLRHFTETNTKYEICINSATIPASLHPYELIHNTEASTAAATATHGIHVVGIHSRTIGILCDNEVVNLIDDAVHQRAGAGQWDERHAGVQSEVDVDCRLLQQKVGQTDVTFQEGNGQRGSLPKQCHTTSWCQYLRISLSLLMVPWPILGNMFF